MARILIPENPLERNVLAAIRTLGQKGHEIHVAYPVDNEKSKRKYFGKVLISTINKRLHGIVFYNARGELAGKQFFEDYKVIKGLAFPMKIVKINYIGEIKNYQITTFENIQLNNLNETNFYDYPLPVN